MECVICGAFYAPNQNSRQKTCGRKECAAELKRRTRAKREGRKIADLSPRKCEICGEVYKPTQTNQKVCSNFHCKKAAKKAQAIKRYNDTTRKEKTETCPICGRRYAPKRDIQKTCGSAACRASLARINRQIERSCRHCGTKFKVDPTSTKTFCCADCETEWKERQARLEDRVDEIWPSLDHMPPECRSWYQAEMMPVL